MPSVPNELPSVLGELPVPAASSNDMTWVAHWRDPAIPEQLGSQEPCSEQGRQQEVEEVAYSSAVAPAELPPEHLFGPPLVVDQQFPALAQDREIGHEQVVSRARAVPMTTRMKNHPNVHWRLPLVSALPMGYRVQVEEPYEPAEQHDLNQSP